MFHCGFCKRLSAPGEKRTLIVVETHKVNGLTQIKKEKPACSKCAKRLSKK